MGQHLKGSGFRAHFAQLTFLAGLLAGLVACLADVPSAFAIEPDVHALLRRVDEMWRGESSRAVMTMSVTTRRYTRTISLEAWSQGSDRSLIVILKPRKDRGIATLKVEANIWNFLPKISRVTKVPPSMMMSSWMGSHFTNDDLVKESLYEEDYNPCLTFSGDREGRAIYEITLDPKPDAPVVWGRVVMEIEQKALLPIRALYYDEEGELARTLRFENRREFGGRLIPATLTVIPADKPAESTIVNYDALTFDLDLPPEFFSLRRLRSGGGE